ncbi:MAG TPA: T9SS type A sorting domain-containing protein [Flavobacteriales bacterium]|nr:T9SS type A sorting domain-containing protein [Flavobacteriales bacterium]
MKPYTITIFVFAFFCNTCISQNWTGHVNADWNNPANWDQWPLDDEDIIIDPANYTGAAASPVISSASVFSPAQLNVQNGAMLSIQDNINTSDRIEFSGAGTKVFLTGGILHAAGTGNNGRIIVGEDAEFTINDGTVISNQRFIVEAGATVILNDGLLNAGETFALVDGSGPTSSSFTLNNGSVYTQDLDFENELGDFNPALVINGGNITINGNTSWLGEAPGAGTPAFIMHSGSCIFNGNITNDSLSLVRMRMLADGDAQVVFNGEFITLGNPTDSIRVKGSAAWTFFGNNTFKNNGIFYAENIITVFSGTTTLDGTGKFNFQNLLIDTGDTLRHVSPDSICIRGNFTNNGFYNDTVNSVAFKGLDQQLIEGSSITTFNNLVINNAEGVVLTNHAKVNGSLLMVHGILTTTPAAMLLMQLNAISIGGSDTSYVNGPVRKTGNAGFVFPTGQNGKFAPIEIGPSLLPTNEFTATYHRVMYPDTIPLISPLTQIDTLEYWSLQKESFNDSVSVKLHWKNAAESNIFNCKTLTIAHWNGSAWVNIKSSNTGSCLGGGIGYAESDTKLTEFGIFTFATYDTNAVSVQDVPDPNTALNIFPIPLQKGQDLELANVLKGPVRICIWDIDGRMVLERNFRANANHVSMNTSRLETGLYLVEVYEGKKRTVKKLVVE